MIDRGSCLAAMSAASRRDAHSAVVLAAETPEPALVLVLEELMAQGLLSRSRATERKMAGDGRAGGVLRR